MRRTPATRGDLAAVVLVVALIAGSLTVPSWIALVVPDPIAYPNSPFPVINAPVRAGDPIRLMVARCVRGAHVEFTATRVLTRQGDGLRVAVPASSGTLQGGCSTSQTAIDVLPDDLEAGVYVLEGTTTVRNRWRTSDVSWRTERFQVTPRGGGSTEEGGKP